MPLEDLQEREAGMMRDRESRLGRFTGSAVLGTFARDESAAQTVVRLDFERASVFNIYIWGPQRLRGILGVPELPPVRYAPVSATEFRAFSLDAINLPPLIFGVRDGQPVATLGEGPSAVVARRER